MGIYCVVAASDNARGRAMSARLLELEPGAKLRLSCPNCSTMCEASIPDCSSGAEHRIRYYIRCPSCKEVHDLSKMSNVSVSSATASSHPSLPARVGPAGAAPDVIRLVTKRTRDDTPPDVVDGAPMPKAARPAPAVKADLHPEITADKAVSMAEVAPARKGHAATVPAAQPAEVPGGHAALGPPPRLGRMASSDEMASGSSDGTESSQELESDNARSDSAFQPGAFRKASSSRVKGAARSGGAAGRRSALSVGSSSVGAGTLLKQRRRVEMDGCESKEASDHVETRPYVEGLSRAFRPLRYNSMAWHREPPGRPSCEEAFDMAEEWVQRRGGHKRFCPCWRPGDKVEVAWKGKGFEGAWAEAEVVMLDGLAHVMVRFEQFVDESGSKLVERMEDMRLRIAPPARVSGWVPVVGEKVEGRWNDCWWEGFVREMHALKGILFQYERYSNWMWVPLHAIRRRPPYWSFYSRHAYIQSIENECSAADLVRLRRLPAGVCGTLGCMLRNNHNGLCQIQPKVRGSRRASLQERAQMQQQQRLWQEITGKREVTTRLAQARARALREAEKAGTTIVAPKGNLAQWHINFRMDEFSAALREVRVVAFPEVANSGSDSDTIQTRGDDAAMEQTVGELRGVIVLGFGDSLGDMAHMLRTELGFRRDANIVCFTRDNGGSLELSSMPQRLKVLPLLPDGDCELHVRDPMCEASAAGPL